MYLSKNDIKTLTLENGVKRSILAYNESLMMVKLEFHKGQRGALHHHAHTQSTYILKGKFEFTIGTETFTCEEGDSLVFPSGVEHGCLCLEDGILLDNFTPQRDDFLV